MKYSYLIIPLIIFLIVGCGPSKEEIASIKEQIATLELEISELQAAANAYDVQSKNVEAAEQRLEELKEPLSNAPEGSQTKIELESQFQGAEERMKREKKKLIEMEADYNATVKLIEAKKEKVTTLSEQIN